MGKLTIPKLTTRKFILSTSEEIGPGADYSAYLASGDESHLRLTGSPVRVLLRPLSSEHVLHAMEQSGREVGTVPQISMDALLWRATARQAICGLENLDGPTAGLLERETGMVVGSWAFVHSLTASDCINMVAAAMALGESLKTLPKP